MTAPKVEPGRIGILDQLAVLPPAVRIGSGLLMLAMGVTGVVMIPASFWSLALLGLALMLGIPLLFGGILDQRRERIETAERARAESELSELRPAIAAAVEQRHNVGRLLRQRGYTSGKVRRWIALECDVVLSVGDSVR